MSQIATIITQEGQVGYIETGEFDQDYYWEYWGSLSSIKEFLQGINGVKRKATKLGEEGSRTYYTESEAELTQKELEAKLGLIANQLKNIPEVWEVNVYERH